MDAKVTLNVSVLPPVMSQRQFAALVGVSDDTVRGWVEAKTVPVCKIGKQRFINIQSFVTELDADKSVFIRGDYDD